MTNSTSSSLIQHATSVHLADEDDDPRQARSELLNLVKKFNILLDNLGSAAFKNIGNNEGEIVALVHGGTLPQNLQPSTSTMPTGTLLDFFMRTPPSGWLEANGQSINNQNANHRDLFLLLFRLATEGDLPLTNLFTSEQDEQDLTGENAENAWDRSISMKLPDLRGRTRIGTGQGTALTSRLLGSPLGEENIVLAKNHLPRIQLSIKHPGYSEGGRTTSQYFKLQSSNTDTFEDSNRIIDNKTEYMGSSESHPNMQPSFVVLTCIKY